MSKLIWILARCMATALLGVLVLLTFGSSGAQAHLLTPPMAAAMVQVCRGQPCLAKLPDAAPLLPGQSGKCSKSSKRLTRRST
jgi:hypothetical protein